ncbi:glutamate--cysteine ligase GCS2 [Halorhabdus utahensis DSM 12940]|uniref:Glutamate--cysteine ligase GCS2 n=1 Tax=Halorhabdus utahensis (strain DSM 12940 / JCM 11049 / AX-2) TaxID=519442 RepID=C7NPM2_HALUD|nr:glutamate-cysteine ligase family protein [Halorhabdus utahensis]ACV12777.1 glutamate--cysteine ligase GCS2 [Halorhabdus utahensis DSM 12940]
MPDRIDPTTGAKQDGGGNDGGVAPLRRSIEVEYWVIDDEGRLTDPGELSDAGEGVEREFVEPLLEIKTTPCESTAALRTEFYERLDGVLRRASDHGKRLVPLGTPMHDGEIADRPGERTRIQDRVVGSDFEYVRHCAGTHIHVEQQPGHVIEQLNTLIALDPALALVNSSPYFGHERLTTGARSQLYRRMAYETLPHQGRLWPYAEDLEEWAKRLEHRYGEFVTQSIITGFDRERVESYFGPESAVWTPVQLRERFSTVEWRSPDAALPSQLLRLADDVASIVSRVTEAAVRIEGDRGGCAAGEIVLPKFDAVSEYVDAAITDGLDSSAVRSYLDRMGFSVEAYDPLAGEMDAPAELTESQARDRRLEYADRLEADVRRVSSITAD